MDGYITPAPFLALREIFELLDLEDRRVEVVLDGRGQHLGSE